jgi:acetolactate decarboxylase
VAVDEHLIAALHVQSLPASELAAELEGEREQHVIFQASTVAALLDGAYDGDVSFAELERHGDHGLGTLNGCDGEMIAVDGRFLRADVEGRLHDVPGSAKTPFAVLTFFAPTHRIEVTEQLTQDELFALIDREVGHPEQVHALRIDGRFAAVHARSVPKQSKPYRPLTEVVAAQRVFDFNDVDGTMVGFRFPHREEGLNIPGYHLHFVDSERASGGHVLNCSLASGTVAVDDSVEVRLELPAGVDLGADEGDDGALDRVEHEG